MHFILVGYKSILEVFQHLLTIHENISETKFVSYLDMIVKNMLYILENTYLVILDDKFRNFVLKYRNQNYLWLYQNVTEKYLSPCISNLNMDYNSPNLPAQELTILLEHSPPYTPIELESLPVCLLRFKT